MDELNNSYPLTNNISYWFHEVNNNDWTLNGYRYITTITTYEELLYIYSRLENYTSGMFFIMKNDILPIYEDSKNEKGGYWSIKVSKRDTFELIKKITYYIFIHGITINNKYDDYINGFSVSPKINNCIIKIWTSDFNAMNTQLLINIPSINWTDAIYKPFEQ